MSKLHAKAFPFPFLDIRVERVLLLGSGMSNGEDLHV